MKATEQIRTFHNENGPDITTVDQPVIESEGLFFKDVDGSGELKAFSDWRLDPKTRAKALTYAMSTEEKIGQIFVTSRNPYTTEGSFPEGVKC